MSYPARLAAILVAGGTGSRFGATTPKQFVEIAGRPVLRHAAEALLRSVAVLQPVGDAGPVAAALAGLPHLPVVAGGATRQESVLRGLEALASDPPDIVLIHDGCRPYLPPGTIATLVEALVQGRDGAIPAVPIADTLKRADASGITGTIDRAGLFRAQTPQAFPYAALLALHRAAPLGATDDAGLVEAAGGTVAIVTGSEDNIKLTYQEDHLRLSRILLGTMLPHVGTGFDVHALQAGRPLVLCGVAIPHDRGLAGHSDADVGIHALCDAIYGALAEGDIGRHFPPSEAQWKDADSARFLRHAAGRVTARGGFVVHVDVTLICEQPKVTPLAPAMIARLAELLGIDTGRVSVKATTTERLGFTGRREGIAAQAAATVMLPD